MELRQMQYLVAIYEEGSLTGASRRMNVVQPALSQQLQKLEKEIGRPLFTRAPKGMVPTQAGVEAYESFVKIAHDLEVAMIALSGDGGPLRGTVSIGVVSSAANTALSETLQKFTVKYPDVRVKVTGGYTGELLEQLRMSRIDLAIINMPPLKQDPHIFDIVKEDFCLVAAPDSIKIDKPVVHLEDIARMRLVIPSPRHGLRSIIERVADNVGVSLDPNMEFDEITLIEGFVRATDYVTILPPIAVNRAIRNRDLKAYQITPTISRRLVYQTNPSRPLSAAAKVLIDEIREDIIEFTFSIGNLAG